MLGLVPRLLSNMNKTSAKPQFKLSVLRRNSSMKIWIWVLLGHRKEQQIKEDHNLLPLPFASTSFPCTDKKEKIIFLIFKEIQRDRVQSHI